MVLDERDNESTIQANEHIGFLRDSIRLNRGFHNGTLEEEVKILLDESVERMDELSTEFDYMLGLDGS